MKKIVVLFFKDFFLMRICSQYPSALCFWIWGHQTCGILGPPTRGQTCIPALEGEVLTTGLPESLNCSFKKKCSILLILSGSPLIWGILNIYPKANNDTPSAKSLTVTASYQRRIRWNDRVSSQRDTRCWWWETIADLGGINYSPDSPNGVEEGFRCA